MAHDLALVHRQLVLPPDRRRRPEAPRGAVQIGVQTADLSQCRLGARRLGPRPDRHQLCLRLVRIDMVAPRLAGDIAEDLAALVVEAEHLGRRRETRRVQMAQEGMDRRRPRTHRSAQGLADSDDAGRRPAATESLLEHVVHHRGSGSPRTAALPARLRRGEGAWLAPLPHRLALLEERGRALAEVLGQIRKLDDLVPRAECRAARIERGEDRELRRAQRERRVRRERPGEVAHVALDLRERQHRAHRAAPVRLRCVHELRGEEELLRRRWAEDLDHPGDVQQRQRVPDGPRDRYAEARVLRGHADVAHERERGAAARGHAADERDGRLGEPLDRAERGLDVRLVGLRVLARADLADGRDVAPGHEGILAAALEDDDADRIVGGEAPAELAQVGVHRLRERVARGGTVEGDPGHRAATLLADVAHRRRHYDVTPAAKSASMSRALMPASTRISRECSPRRGPLRSRRGGVFERWSGEPIERSAPSTGWGLSAKMPRAARCGSARTSAYGWMRRQGRPASRSERSMSCPTPSRSRTRSAHTTAYAPYSAVAMSTTGTPTFTGGRSSSPVALMIPLSACRMRSRPGRSRYGPVRPKPVTER